MFHRNIKERAQQISSVIYYEKTNNPSLFTLQIKTKKEKEAKKEID